MPDGPLAGLDLEETGKFVTPEFASALRDASLLLDHAAKKGLLPATEASGQGSGTLVTDIIRTYEAAKDSRLTAETVIAFWLAYARLANLVKPVTAASLRACSQASLG